ncbi:amino acid adenylation domain-containing protein, partial [Streptomyces sp. NPDC052052]|uniref:amino acid adenylation domain-containing protein n=1 Tax=Streptomyces sp. NPDC052052 TaxID=3154756 RepID=UPI00343A8A7C
GGHSLLAVRLVTRLSERLGRPVTVTDLFDRPTPELLATTTTDGRSPRKSVGSVPRPGTLPLSSAQQRMWFANQVDPRGYVVPLCLRLSGVLDRTALAQAWDDVIGRHEILRTRYPHRDGVPHQEILPSTPGLAPLQIRTVPAPEIPDRIAECVGSPFDLTVELPVKAWLFSVAGHDENENENENANENENEYDAGSGTSEHVLLLSVHHIATDELSSGPLMNDLSRAYTARCEGRQAPWEPLPVQYADYAVWQAALLDPSDTAEEMAQGLAYWKRTLEGMPERIPLPVDRPYPARPRQEAGGVDFVVPEQVHQALAGLASRSRATLFMVMQAALAAVLGRHGVGDDIPIATPVAGRYDASLDDLVGCFINTICLRTPTRAAMTFTEAVEAAREVTLGALTHQEVPFEQVIREINPDRSGDRTGFVQVFLSVLHSLPDAVRLPGLSVVEEGTSHALVPGDLSLHLLASGDLAGEPGEIRGHLAYRLDLFDEGSVRGLADRFVRFLECVAADPGMRVGDAELLLEGEREWLAGVAGVEGSSGVGSAGVVPELFEAQVARSSSGVAVVAGGVSLSFGAVNAAANRLARWLVGRGVGPDARVVLGVSRSVELVVAVLGVLKAGGAYVPVGEDLPAARVRAVLEDAAPVVVLGDGRASVSWPEGTHWVDLADVLRQTAVGNVGEEDLTDADRLAPLLPEHAAYLLFTSGSTGRPKGVTVPHRAIHNLFHAHQEAFQEFRAERTRVLLTAPLTFDIHWEAFLWMFEGNEVYVVDDETRLDVPALARYITDHDIGFVSTTPSLVRQLTDVGLFDGGSSHPVVLQLGGEAVDEGLWEELTQLDGVAAFNFYGPTESAVWSTYTRLVKGDTVSIGRSPANVWLYVVDVWGGLVPPGVRGELCVGGAGVARGYAGRPGLTAERFVPDPFGGDPGARMYRTGDLVRWREDGLLEFFGRIDGQVKVRGYRIELADVEAAVLRQEGVGRAAVSVFEHAGDRRLVAYVEPAAEHTVDVERVRQGVAGELP